MQQLAQFAAVDQPDRLGDLGAHRAVRRQQMVADPEVLGLDVVRVGDHPASDVGRRPRDRGECGAEQPAGARFGHRNGQAGSFEFPSERRRLGE